MSGTIETSPHTHWSVAGWLFDWTVQSIADRIPDDDLARELRQVVADNVRWLGLNDYGEHARGLLDDVIVSRLPLMADEQFDDTWPGRDAVIGLVNDLGAQVRRPS